VRGQLELESFSGVAVRESLSSRAALPLLLVPIALVLLWRCRWRRAVLSGRGVPIVVIALLLVLAVRLTATPDRVRVDLGRDAPPLVWPAGWSVGEDATERVLGPGFRRLVAAAQTEQAADARGARGARGASGAGQHGGLAPIVWTGTGGEDIRRGMHLAYALASEARVLDSTARPSGLCVFTGVAARGEVVLDTPAGVLARVELP
jgi:hypothetical protein